MVFCRPQLFALLFRVKELGPESKNRRPAPGDGGEPTDVGKNGLLSPMGDKIVNNQDLAMLCTHSVRQFDGDDK